MKKCNQCGAELPDNVKFCGSCGAITTNETDVPAKPDGDSADAGVVKNQQDELGDQLRLESASTTEQVDSQVNVEKDESPKPDTLKSGGDEEQNPMPEGGLVSSSEHKPSNRVWIALTLLFAAGFFALLAYHFYETNRLIDERQEYIEIAYERKCKIDTLEEQILSKTSVTVEAEAAADAAKEIVIYEDQPDVTAVAEAAEKAAE